eukprot:753497-Hanusia_phi.AAC.3
MGPVKEEDAERVKNREEDGLSSSFVSSQPTGIPETAAFFFPPPSPDTLLHCFGEFCFLLTPPALLLALLSPSALPLCRDGGDRARKQHLPPAARQVRPCRAGPSPTRRHRSRRRGGYRHQARESKLPAAPDVSNALSDGAGTWWTAAGLSPLRAIT